VVGMREGIAGNLSNNKLDESNLNFSRGKIGKSSDEIVKSCLSETIKNCKDGASVVLELPTENYFQVNVSSAKFLIDNGFEGIYVSFQRPLKNIYSLFKDKSVDINKLVFIDLATQCSIDESDNNYEYIDISLSLNIEQLGKSVYSQIGKLKSNNIFILIDSLNTLSLYKSSEEIIEFADILVQNINKYDSKNIIILFNVAQDLCQKDFIKDIIFNADQVINVLKSIEKYSEDIINPDMLT